MTSWDLRAYKGIQTGKEVEAPPLKVLKVQIRHILYNVLLPDPLRKNRSVQGLTISILNLLKKHIVTEDVFFIFICQFFVYIWLL
jgi:hypothetical protein